MKKIYPLSFALLGGMAVALATGQIGAEPASEPSKPLELRKIMQDMGKEMETIAGAISREEWKQVESAALRIADHPRPPMEERGRIIGFLGKEMAQFKGYDTKTHDTARHLAEAAAHNDGPAVISTFAALQRSCLECHRQFRRPIQEHFYGKQ